MTSINNKIQLGSRHSTADLSAPTVRQPRGSNPKLNIYAFSVYIVEIYTEIVIGLRKEQK